MATAEAETLYGLPPGEFTAARNALARQLRSDGRRDAAAEVAALRKPAPAAWVVNRLARDEPEEIRRLIDAAAGIRSGRSDADAGFREALERLTTAARRLLEADGRVRDDVLQQVAGTLREGAAAEPELLASGTLVRPLEPSGFGAMAGASLPTARRAARRREPPPAGAEKLEAARSALAEARAEARRLEREAREAERAAERARAAAGAAHDRVTAAEARLDRARGR
jgi:hypothetical protein